MDFFPISLSLFDSALSTDLRCKTGYKTSILEENLQKCTARMLGVGEIVLATLREQRVKKECVAETLPNVKFCFYAHVQ